MTTSVARGRRCLAAGLALALTTAFSQPATAAEDDLNACQSDAMIVFDASGSMGTSDYTLKLPRIARLKQAMARVIPEVAPVRRLGLIVYGEGAYNDCSSIALRMRPTSDAAQPMLRIIEAVNPRGRTPLTQSVRQAAEVLDFTRREAVVVLVTDGEETCGQDPCKTAAALKRAGPHLTVHVIGYRDEQQQGFFTARCMADETGGQYVSASTEDELVKALRKTLGCPFVTENNEGRRLTARIACSAPAVAPH
jgi:Ca-activated chloride channel family protein